MAARRDVRWLRVGLVGVCLVLALMGCGKYGPPVRPPAATAEPKATSVAPVPGAAAAQDEDRKEEKQ